MCRDSAFLGRGGYSLASLASVGFNHVDCPSQVSFSHLHVCVNWVVFSLASAVAAGAAARCAEGEAMGATARAAEVSRDADGGRRRRRAAAEATARMTAKAILFEMIVL